MQVSTHHLQHCKTHRNTFEGTSNAVRKSTCTGSHTVPERVSTTFLTLAPPLTVHALACFFSASCDVSFGIRHRELQQKDLAAVSHRRGKVTQLTLANATRELGHAVCDAKDCLLRKTRSTLFKFSRCELLIGVVRTLAMPNPISLFPCMTIP